MILTQIRWWPLSTLTDREASWASGGGWRKCISRVWWIQVRLYHFLGLHLQPHQLWGQREHPLPGRAQNGRRLTSFKLILKFTAWFYRIFVANLCIRWMWLWPQLGVLRRIWSSASLTRTWETSTCLGRSSARGASTGWQVKARMNKLKTLQWQKY